jgi:hypothetical protein
MILFLVLSSCKSPINQDNKLYIIFEERNENMSVYERKKPLGYNFINVKYYYHLENGNLIFAKDEEKKSNKAPLSNHVKYNLKDINWLSDKTKAGLEQTTSKFFMDKNVHIVIIDSASQTMKIVPVYFIQEIE